MPFEQVTVKSFRSSAARYKVRIGSGLLHASGDWARDCLSGDTRRIAIVSNRRVFGLYGKDFESSLRSAGYAVSFWEMGDGERFKDIRSLEKALRFLSESGIGRSDAVVALGGGVVGDLAGFAAAVHLRGVPFLQIPTTVLSMIDSSVGGKTGVNSAFGKNLIGAFHFPAGVLVDVDVSRTLPRREWTAGLCEAVKHGAIGGRKLFDATADFLQAFPGREFHRHFSDPNFRPALSKLVRDHVIFKARMVRGDPVEEPSRVDKNSRKVLNFGHTFAHALEKATNYRYFKHGEAVGWGMILAAELSKNLEILNPIELKLLNDVVHRAGKLPPVPDIDPREIFEAFKFDKKSLANSVQWVLLRAIGEPQIVSGADIPVPAIRAAVKTLFR